MIEVSEVSHTACNKEEFRQILDLTAVLLFPFRLKKKKYTRRTRDRTFARDSPNSSLSTKFLDLTAELSFVDVHTSYNTHTSAQKSKYRLVLIVVCKRFLYTCLPRDIHPITSVPATKHSIALYQIGPLDSKPATPGPSRRFRSGRGEGRGVFARRSDRSRRRVVSLPYACFNLSALVDQK